MNFHHYRPEPLPLALPAVNAGMGSREAADLALAESLRSMLDDADWPLSSQLHQRGLALLDSRHRVDALPIEASGSELEGEVRDYLDFCRFRSENPIRGSAEEKHTAWESDCLAQANALLHRQTLRERGYARPEPFNRPFRVC